MASRPSTSVHSGIVARAVARCSPTRAIFSSSWVREIEDEDEDEDEVDEGKEE